MSPMKSFIAVLVFLTSLSSFAGPPFNYHSAVAWADESTKTDIPKAQRVYVFGPQKIAETYTLNDKPAKHDVPIRRIRPHRDPMPLGTLLRSLRDDVSSEFVVLVYRRANPIEPVLRLPYLKALESTFSIQSSDLIDITIPARGFIH